jgi:hypothetical protein
LSISVLDYLSSQGFFRKDGVMTHGLRLLALLTCLSLVGLFQACDKKKKDKDSSDPSTTPGNPNLGNPNPGQTDTGQTDTDTNPFAAGKKVFATAGCARCHSINGTRPGFGRGPMMGGPGGQFPGRPPMRGGPGGPGGFRGPGGPGRPGGFRGGAKAPDLGKVRQGPGPHRGMAHEVHPQPQGR